MPAHRLPVYQPAEVSADAYQGAPRILPGRAIAVLDPSDGTPSLAFAARFGQELAALGRAIPVALVAFERAPHVLSAQRALFPAQQRLDAFSAQASDAAIAEQLALSPQGLWVVVGQAALLFAPVLSIVVAADIPLLRWPDPLRAARERISVALSGDGLSVAVALAQQLSRERSDPRGG
jgi:hypothetical protein